MEKISPQVRILAIVLVLAGVAGMLAMRMLAPAAAPATVAAVTPPADGAKAAAKTGRKTRPAQPPAKAPAVQPAAKPQAVEPAVAPSGLPVALEKALREHEVVVLSLVVPGSRVDELAAAEARMGAEAGGVGYLPLNVLNEDVARALLTKLDGLRAPSLIVVKRPGEVVLQLPGFVDRETVAQAAANASS